MYLETPTALDAILRNVTVALYSSERIIGDMEDALAGASDPKSEAPAPTPPGIHATAMDIQNRVNRANDRLQTILNMLQAPQPIGQTLDGPVNATREQYLRDMGR